MYYIIIHHKYDTLKLGRPPVDITTPDSLLKEVTLQL